MRWIETHTSCKVSGPTMMRDEYTAEHTASISMGFEHGTTSLDIM
jgi:hypothetical protein